MTTVVGIDHSLSDTGIAIIRPDTQPELLTVSSSGKNTDDRPTRGRRMREMRTAIMDNIPRDTSLAVIEGMSFGHNQPGQDRIHHLWWLISDAFDHLGLPLAVVPPNTVKKWAADDGRAKKPAVRAAISEMWRGLRIPNSDTADALCCGTIGAQHLGLPLPYLVLERHRLALSKIEWPQARG
ncbi:hypothetical protein IU459_11960 [Nocardia amamiensis]|uniref:Uncharacterized protein n=1 Tax=Nocardia amamiensis TaxID=404578 RepID=A0ABS0CPR2_9NOCA|nr:hypothetical protein [Nocardia amamiensis]MBF6298256.1 hypothetical protein [Nocardia amamiensis]